MKATMSDDGFSRFSVHVEYRIGYDEFFALLATLTVQNKKWPRTRTRLLKAVREMVTDRGNRVDDRSGDLTHVEQKRIELYVWKLVSEVRAEIEYARTLETS